MKTTGGNEKPWREIPRRGWGKRPAIVIVDMSKGFSDPELTGREMPYHVAAVENIARALPIARERGIPVVHVIIGFDEQLSDFGEWMRPTTRLGEGLTQFIVGSAFCEENPLLIDPEPTDRDLYFRKTRASAFFGTPLAETLTGLGVDTVVVTGCNTCGCIRATLMDSFSYGFRTIVPEDMVADSDQVAHHQTLVDTAPRYCDVPTTDEVLAALPELEGTLRGPRA